MQSMPLPRNSRGNHWNIKEYLMTSGGDRLLIGLLIGLLEAKYILTSRVPHALS
jgi:hypothetical protein